MPLLCKSEENRVAFPWASINRRDLEEEMTLSGVEHIHDMRLIVPEPSGQITVLKQANGRLAPAERHT